MNHGQINLSELLVQIETAAQQMRQSGASASNTISDEAGLIFKKIAGGLINEKSRSTAGAGASLVNNNANAAKADIKG